MATTARIDPAMVWAVATTARIDPAMVWAVRTTARIDPAMFTESGASVGNARVGLVAD